MNTSKCMICKSSNIEKFLSLGKTPLANSFLKPEQLTFNEPSFPLEVLLCKDCTLVQLSYVVPPEAMFKNYLYVSSTSDALRQHFGSFAEDVVTRFINSENDLVIDIGSNDGTLLKEFKKHNVRVLGVEPATNIAEIANVDGIETVNVFFNEKTSLKVLSEKGRAKIITATNVFAHVSDLDGFVKGVYSLLDKDGVFIIETPYVVNLLENNEFDTIYHEHLRYYSVKSLFTLFERYMMEIIDIQKVSIHGGSIRVFVKKKGSELPVSDSVNEFINLERELEIDSLETYLKFSRNVENIKTELLALLKKLKSEGKRIVGYGAAAKGNTLLNYCKIGTDILDYIVDKNKYKQELFTPGMHIPVVLPEKILEDKPDYVLVLAWNFADEIMKQQSKYKEMGGKFIIPIPEPTII